jgi:hypothetical protein
MMKKINNFNVIPHMGKILIAGIAMAVVTVFLFLIGANVIVNVLLSAAIYFALLWAFREPLLVEMKRMVAGAERATI